MIVSELIKNLMKMDPNSRVLINIVDDDRILRKVPIKKIVRTDTGLSLHTAIINKQKIDYFSLSGGDEKVLFLT